MISENIVFKKGIEMSKVKCKDCPYLKKIDSECGYCSGSKCEIKVRASANEKFAKWICEKLNLNVDRVLLEYEEFVKEQKRI